MHFFFKTKEKNEILAYYKTFFVLKINKILDMYLFFLFQFFFFFFFFHSKIKISKHKKIFTCLFIYNTKKGCNIVLIYQFVNKKSMINSDFFN